MAGPPRTPPVMTAPLQPAEVHLVSPPLPTLAGQVRIDGYAAVRALAAGSFPVFMSSNRLLHACIHARLDAMLWPPCGPKLRMLHAHVSAVLRIEAVLGLPPCLTQRLTRAGQLQGCA